MDKEDIQTKSDDIFLEDVKKLITAGDFSSAISKLLLELTSNSNNIELLYLLSVSYRYNKNYSKAIESLNSLFALNPEHSRALQEMGHIYRAMGDYNRALEAYHRATRLNSALTASLNAQIKILGQGGQAQQIKPLKAQLDYIQSLPKPLIAVIDLLAQGKLVKAEQICKLFLQKNPRNVEGMRLLSQIALKLGVLDDAEFLLESALEFSRTIRESELSIFKCYGSDKITLALFIKQKYF